MHDSYQIPKAFLDIVTESKSIRRRFWAILATLSSFVGNRETKPSIKTKGEIVEGFSLRLITPPRACEPVLEVETDLADSGTQSGSVGSSWLVILPMANCHFFQVKESGPGPFDFNVVASSNYISSCFSTLKLQDQFYCCFKRNIHIGTDAPEA